MDAYPEYVFVQSSVAYIDWMRRYYPAIYEGIRRQTAEGRWEPNGGSWIECDGNMTGGECLIRQFVKGQRYLRDNLHYQADAFWAAGHLRLFGRYPSNHEGLRPAVFPDHQAVLERGQCVPLRHLYLERDRRHRGADPFQHYPLLAGYRRHL